MKHVDSIVSISVIVALVVAAMRSRKCVPPTIGSLPTFPNAQNVRRIRTRETRTAVAQNQEKVTFDPEVVNNEELMFETSDTPQEVISFYHTWLLSHGWLSPFAFIFEDKPSHSLYLKYGCRDFARVRFRGFDGFAMPLEVPKHETLIYIEASANGGTTAVKLSVIEWLIVTDSFLTRLRFRLAAWRRRIARIVGAEKGNDLPPLHIGGIHG